jgi:t-SNARE complex subunit (syntaxin)
MTSNSKISNTSSLGGDSNPNEAKQHQRSKIQEARKAEDKKSIILILSAIGIVLIALCILNNMSQSFIAS